MGQWRLAALWPQSEAAHRQFPGKEIAALKSRSGGGRRWKEGKRGEAGEEGEEGGGREGGWGRGTQAQCTVLRAAAKAWTVPSGSE